MATVPTLEAQLEATRRELSDLQAEYVRLAYGIDIQFPNTVGAGYRALHADNEGLRARIKEQEKTFQDRVGEEVERRLKEMGVVQVRNEAKVENHEQEGEGDMGVGDGTIDPRLLVKSAPGYGDEVQGMKTPVKADADTMMEEETGEEVCEDRGSEVTAPSPALAAAVQGQEESVIETQICKDIARYGHCKRGRKCRMVHPGKAAGH